MKKQFSKFLPYLAIAGSLFICGCPDGIEPEGVKSRQKGDPCDEVNLCLSGLVCEGGFCRVLCNDKNECGPKEHCENSRCVANLSDACPTGFTGDLCDQCLPDHWGKECIPCNCSGHGECNAGLTGDGTCTCDKEWEGKNCSTSKNCPEGFGGIDGKDCSSCLKGYYGDFCEPCDCNHGECWDGKSGNGQCKADSCAEGWDGPNCDKCADGLSGPLCNIPKRCKNGTPNLGLTGDGHCSECFDKWTGEDCDVCPTGYYDGVDNCVDCTKDVQNSHFGQEECTYTDTRDEQKYNVVKIGNQIWMADNMRYELGTFYNVNGNPSNNKVFGLLYPALTTIKICPTGWHIPIYEENSSYPKNDFQELIDYAENKRTSDTVFLSLISKSNTWIDYPDKGGDDFGFNAQPAGFLHRGSYPDFQTAAYFLTSDDNWLLSLDGDAILTRNYYNDGYSVRCLKD